MYIYIYICMIMYGMIMYGMIMYGMIIDYDKSY